MTKENRKRQCLVTGDKLPACELIRFVCAPDGSIIPDLAAKLPGRGCWVTADRGILQQAVDRKLLLRAGQKMHKADGSGIKIQLKDGLLDFIEELLLKRCLDYIGLSNKSGIVISGFEKVRKILVSGKTNILMTASDSADNSRSKISQGLDNLQIIDMFAREELSNALGQDNAVHLALLPDKMRTSLLQEISRYERCRKKVIN